MHLREPFLNGAPCTSVEERWTRRYFRGQQYGPAWKCKCPKNTPTKNARIRGNFMENSWTTRKHYKFQERMHCYWEDRRKVFSVEDL